MARKLDDHAHETSATLRRAKPYLKPAIASLVAVLSLGACNDDAASTDADDTQGTTADAAVDATSGSSADAATSSATDAASSRDASTTYAATTAETIAATTTAAKAFLATLSTAQQSTVSHDYLDDSKTTSWSNFPVTFVTRAGLNLTTDLSAAQRTAALAVLDALLSDEGYAAATGIMGGDSFLLERSSSTESSLGQYYIAFFGEPSSTSAWMLQFGGHHLGINATLDGASGSITFAPSHLGSQPAVYTDDAGNSVQPLAGMYETAFAFYDALTDAQRATMYQGEQLSAGACAAGSTCSFPTGTGIAGAELSADQRQLLLDVIANWAGLADDQTTATTLAAIEATLATTYVNWRGATAYDMTLGEGIFFQISGPNVFIEFACQQGSAGADVSGYTTAGWGHIHSLYRDPSNDYANSVTQQAAASGGPGGGSAPPGN